MGRGSAAAPSPVGSAGLPRVAPSLGSDSDLIDTFELLGISWARLVATLAFLFCQDENRNRTMYFALYRSVMCRPSDKAQLEKQAQT